MSCIFHELRQSSELRQSFQCHEPNDRLKMTHLEVSSLRYPLLYWESCMNTHKLNMLCIFHELKESSKCYGSWESHDSFSVSSTTTMLSSWYSEDTSQCVNFYMSLGSWHWGDSLSSWNIHNILSLWYSLCDIHRGYLSMCHFQCVIGFVIFWRLLEFVEYRRQYWVCDIQRIPLNMSLGSWYFHDSLGKSKMHVTMCRVYSTNSRSRLNVMVREIFMTH